MSGKTNKMRVLVDTNVLFSAVISRGALPFRVMLDAIQADHQLLICTYSINEISRVLQRKRPEALTEWDGLLSRLHFELIHTPNPCEIDFYIPPIRDEGDKPILASAIKGKADIIITGDKDFHSDEIREYIAVYTPSDFIRDFC
ncbi:putative toxin-antitoxin system toxin component, PIN family [Polycladomyces subterraneus]|uniref:Toxin-antitoxin system toxin component, PIN family n=1 Tax=Polycladomyces subterraneus TaxID=1016997 RepID=A0ABT8IM10_9BACL|nr:putative toxin-antitoxin system toxin component, PIN family [Polycladomyces subterraneus]MDN4593825.1 putative toxin-antitoxin system toxin component, PIN family [Polycladomyces subterraneus]